MFTGPARNRCHLGFGKGLPGMVVFELDKEQRLLLTDGDL